MASTLFKSALLLSTLLASDSSPDTGSTLKLSEQNPGFDGVNTDIFDCDSNTKEGSFTFDSGRGVAYFASNHDTVYVEYYAPSFWWTGIAASAQSVNGKHSQCTNCIESRNDESCSSDCSVDHIFVVTGQSEDIQTWISLELQINEDLKLPDLKSPRSIEQPETRKVDLCQDESDGKCWPYIHVKFYKKLENPNNDRWMFPEDDRACFSWITSNPEEGAFVTAVKASTVFRDGVVCADTRYSTKCGDTNHASKGSDSDSVDGPNHVIPATEFSVPPNRCKSNDLSLIIVMDLSDSINSQSMEMGKQWVQQTIEYGKQLMSEHDKSFRSSLITFSSKVELVWNLDDDQDSSKQKLDNLQRPHDPLLEEGQTFTKDALTKTIDEVLPYQFSSDQVLVVVLTDGAPSKDQNPCGSNEISKVLHEQGVRTAVVSIEEGNIFDLSPFQCLYYPYSTEVSFVSVESYRDLLGYQMHPIIMDAAFPINCDINRDVTVPSDLYQVHHASDSKDDEKPQALQDGENHGNDHGEHQQDHGPKVVDQESCIPTERYEPIRKFVYEEHDQEYRECDQSTTEWRLELVDWRYNQQRDQTEYQYSVCTSHLKPFNHCRVSPNEDDPSEMLKSIALQMPCDCEICIGYGVDDMQPPGKFAQLEKAWIWPDLQVDAGKCVMLTMSLMGYAETVHGSYYLEGDNKYESGRIEVPNPCNDGLDNIKYPIPFTPSKEVYPNPKAASCGNPKSMDPFYPTHCEGICDPRQMEYDIKFKKYEYNKGTDQTVFTYSVYTKRPQELPRDFCSYFPYEEAVPLKEVHLSVPCECQHLIQNGQTLSSVTDGMRSGESNNEGNPDGNSISDFWWHFTDLYVQPGDDQDITIVMNGMIPHGMGDYTLVGDLNRCGYGRHVIKVPDICNNRCLWGQWTPWETQWERCSKPCGGGITRRKRRCVSVCDGKTPVMNCHGMDEEIVPCNTKMCQNYPKEYQEIERSAAYWSAYKE